VADVVPPMAATIISSQSRLGCVGDLGTYAGWRYFSVGARALEQGSWLKC
jgi:hypothetical protein